MTNALNGNDFLLQLATIPSGNKYATVAAMRSTSLTLNRSVVDTTNKGSGGWTESLPGGGVKNMSISASGIYVEDVSMRTLFDAFLNQGLARGTITFAVNPTAGDTVTINGVVLEFGVELSVEATVNATVAGVADYLNASINTSIDDATYDSFENQLIIKHKTAGVGGNSFTLAASAATTSGLTLSGGGQGVHWNARLIYGTGDYWQGAFTVESFSFSADQNDVQTYEITLASSGAQLFVE